MERVIGGWINYTVVREGNLTPERVVLGDIITDVVGARAGSAVEPGPRIEVTAPHAVRADRDLTRQLLANLVGNAVKFARPGVPATIAIHSRHDAEPGWIRIDVADQGLGLPPGQESLIFEEFHRAPEHADGVDGTGLGLSLCRKIVARHGGGIAAFNNEHGGATFSLTLPAAR
jgi:signal transduction histidine kinase